ncbi:MAG: helix-turn-helix domain-containing protein [Rubrivivax sp.]
MHIGVLAATLKVPVRKLELLEGNRFDELPGSTFVRALSLSVCRVLKCDPAPVLAALPRQAQVATALADVTHHKSARFARSDAPVVVTRASSARLGWRLTALILALAAVVWWAPKEWSAPWSGGPEASGGSASAPPVASPTVAGAAVPVLATSSPSAIATPGGAASEPLVQTTHGAPLSAGMASQATTASAISVTEASWIEATDLQGRPVWTRTLTPGEVVDLDSGAGVRLTIGNAAATQVRWRGRPVDLSAVTRDNVARLELK